MNKSCKNEKLSHIPIFIINVCTILLYYHTLFIKFHTKLPFCCLLETKPFTLDEKYF